MGLFEKKIKQLESDNIGESASNLAKVASDKAVDIIKELSGKQYQAGKKIIDNVLVFTNASGGTGASTLASNFAYEASQRGLTVLILDLNILCPVQHTYLGLNQELEKNDLVSFLNG